MTSRNRHLPGLDETILRFIQERLVDSRVYIHFTSEKLLSEKIVREGFKYSFSFDKTTEEVSHSLVDLKYKYQLHRSYGNFLIVICIPLHLFKIFKSRGMTTEHDAIYNLGLTDHHPEEELDYTLSPEYIYGFIDLKHRIIHRNKRYLYKGP